MNQLNVWDSIANSWNNFRSRPIKWLEKYAKYVHGRALFFGCGNGRNFELFNADIYGADISYEMLKRAKGKRVLSNELLPFKSSSFDSIVSIASLHCVVRRNVAINEFKRVLRPGGLVLVSVWKRWQWRFFPKNLFTGDVYVPWRKRSGALMRYYHLYTKSELTNDFKDFDLIKIKEEKGNIVAVFRNRA